MKKFLSLLFSIILILLISACDTTKEPKPTKTAIPDYDLITADEMIFNGWLSPVVSRESFEEYKACGFNYIFLLGDYVGAIGGSLMFQAMDICEDLGLNVFIDVSRNHESILSLASSLVEYDCFRGFNYDEPVIYTNTINQNLGIVELAPYIEALHQQYPTVEFMVNLNPTTSTSLPWGTPSFTYEEYIDAQLRYINSIYAASSVQNWISCDDYPLYFDSSSKTKYYLKTTWLQNLEYLANTKRDSEITITSNFFIQSMPFGVGAKSRNRVPTYGDLRLQVYSLMAYGYDSVSFFCYATPPGTGEFTEGQYALIDRNGNKTQIYTDSQKLISEVKLFANTYMQFNDNWLGVYPVLGSNNTDNDDSYYSNSFDSLMEPISSVSRLKGIKKISATEDTIVGYMQDNDGNPGYMVVNYNDTYYGKTSTVTLEFSQFNRALVFIDGVKTDVFLTANKLELDMGLGEGVFVIPYKG